MLTGRGTSRGWIGIDAGSRAVKVAQVERIGAALRLVDAVIVPRCHGSSGSSLAGEIRAAVSLGTSLSGREVAFTMPMQLCQIHEMSVAPGTAAEQQGFIADELETLDGRGMHDCQFDFWSLDDEHEIPSGMVGVVSTAASAAASLASDVQRAGLHCQVLDATPTAVARVVGISQESPETVVAGLDWGYASSTFCVVQDGRPRFVRSLRECGFGNILEAAGEYLGLPHDEAALLFREEGVPDPSLTSVAAPPLQRALAEVAAESLERLTSELLRTLTYLDVHRRRLRPAALSLLGGGATFRNMAPVLAHNIGIPVQTWTMPQLIASDNRASAALPLLAQAIALSMLRWEAA